jgi:hypothetical protein
LNIRKIIYRNKLIEIIAISAISMLSQFSVQAQSGKDTTRQISIEELSKKRQDPVAGLRSIYLQDIVLPLGQGNANSFSVQPVFPFRITRNIKLITYTIIPFQHLPPLVPGDQSQSGMGNILFNGYFSPVEKKGNISWGLGPAIQLPTRTNAALGSNRVSLGPSGLLYFAADKISLGVVVQNYWSLGGSGVNQVNLFSCQYIAFYNFNKGWFLLSNTTLQSNWLAETGQQWTVPVGGGAGKTFQIDKKSKKFYCLDAQLFYNAVRPDVVGNWEAILQFQIVL